jgi:hypothetical protein
VAQLVEELRYKTGGSGFNFHVTDSFSPHSVALGSTQARTEVFLRVQGGRGVDLTALRPCAEWHSKDGSPELHPPCEDL